MISTNNRVIFFGTDEIAASVLSTLIEQKANLVGVVTRADKPQGRKQKIIFSPVKELALKHQLKLFQPIKLIDATNEILALQPDLIITCSYGRIIPEAIINYPKFHCVNIHPSLLPKYRGASPMQTAIMNNDEITGVSLVYMTKELDNGPILWQEAIALDKKETFVSLKQKVILTIKKMLMEHFYQLFDHNLKVTNQSEKDASFTKLIDHKQELINWNQNAEQIDALVRALYDKPCASTIINQQIVKIIQAEPTEISSGDISNGMIMEIDEKGMLIATSDYALRVLVIQLAGKKPTPIKVLINGRLPFKKGDFCQIY